MKNVPITMKARDPRKSLMVDLEASLVRGEKPNGYLWIPDSDGNCHGWIDARQMDKLARAWCRYRGIKP